MKLLIILGIAAASGAASSAGESTSAADAALRRIEERHQGTSGLTARFVQSYRSGMLGREITERGVVSIKPPGRMRWEYKEPEKKTFVADGRRFYFWLPAERQVVIREQAGERGVATLLLAGRGEIREAFHATLETDERGRTRLRLTPRKPEPEIEQVFVETDAASRISLIEVADAQGNRNRFRFDDIRENVKLDDALFRFEIPAGVEVITG